MFWTFRCSSVGSCLFLTLPEHRRRGRTGRSCSAHLPADSLHPKHDSWNSGGLQVGAGLLSSSFRLLVQFDEYEESEGDMKDRNGLNVPPSLQRRLSQRHCQPAGRDGSTVLHPAGKNHHRLLQPVCCLCWPLSHFTVHFGVFNQIKREDHHISIVSDI